MTAYYNEIDPKAAAWLEQLITSKLIAPGDVDTRSIEEISPDDLKEYAQCHFFAGIGAWSYALRQAGWPDDRPVWTGSCPCQGFSEAGQQKGFDDPRHLWPAWYRLIDACRPEVIFGEQVAAALTVGKASKSNATSYPVTDRSTWIDLVQADLEKASYACAPFDIPAAGVGSPNIRQRLWFVAERLADARSLSSQRRTGAVSREETQVCSGRIENGGKSDRHSDGGENGGVADADSGQCDRLPEHGEYEFNREAAERDKRNGESAGSGENSRAADAKHLGHCRPQADQTEQGSNKQKVRLSDRRRATPKRHLATGPTNGLWRDADWLFCRDGKWRPVEPGTFPLANGAPARVGRLRGYGNALNAEVAKVFIESYLRGS